jgi:hypothetical protein
VFVSEKAVADAGAECVRTDSAVFGLTQRVSASSELMMMMIPLGGTQWVYGGRLFVVSARKNKRHHLYLFLQKQQLAYR